MFNPIDEVQKKVDEIKHDVKIAVEIALIQESIRFELSRLLTLDTDPDQQAKYKTALAALGD